LQVRGGRQPDANYRRYIPNTATDKAHDAAADTCANDLILSIGGRWHGNAADK